MNRNEEPRVLRLEQDLTNLENRLASAEARAAQLEQTKPPGPVGDGSSIGGLVVFLPFIVDVQVSWPGGTLGSLGGSVVTVYDATMTVVAVATTGNWGHAAFYFLLTLADVGLTYTLTFFNAGSGFGTVTRTGVITSQGFTFGPTGVSL